MTHAARITEQLTPEQRRERLRAFADRMLIALSNVDDPETGDDVAKGVRLALMIERLYARCDLSEAQATKRAIASIDDQVALKRTLERSSDHLDTAPDVSFITLKPDALAGMQWPRPPRDHVAELKAEIEQLKAFSKPQPVERKPEPRPAAPLKPQTQSLTPAQTALRDRVLNTKAIEKPKGLVWIDHDCGLIRDEDIEVIYGDRLGDMYAGGCSRKGILKTLKAFPREYLNEFWPDIFPLDTT